jgi:hypothetical protein
VITATPILKFIVSSLEPDRGPAVAHDMELLFPGCVKAARCRRCRSMVGGFPRAFARN